MKIGSSFRFVLKCSCPMAVLSILALSSIISSDIDIFFANTNVYESGKFKRALQ